MEEKERIIARFIIELLGAPKDYIEKTLKDFIEKLKTEYTIVKESYEPAKENGSLFTTFCELEGAFENFEELFHFCMNAMPASIEIVEPERIKTENRELTRVLNDIQSRLHEIDMEIKRLKSLNEILDRNTLQTFRNFIQFVVTSGPKGIGEISRAVGVKEKDLKPFLDRMIEENYLLAESDIYFSPK